MGGVMAIYARKGDRIISEDGRYLGMVARDLDDRASRWWVEDFTDLQVDLRNASERLPVTSWLGRQMDRARDG